MPLIWACCPYSAEVLPGVMQAAGARHGFTLLELLVVLTLVAAVAGMVVPATVRSIEAARERAWKQALAQALEALPLQAFHSGRPLSVDVKSVQRLVADLPEDLGIVLSAPLLYSAQGVASGATLQLKRPGKPAIIMQIEAITGQVMPGGAQSRR